MLMSGLLRGNKRGIVDSRKALRKWEISESFGRGEALKTCLIVIFISSLCTVHSLCNTDQFLIFTICCPLQFLLPSMN